ncbi:MAG: VCBS repeat-containing protein [Candidatus Thermoplasmatota archaeon]
MALGLALALIVPAVVFVMAQEAQGATTRTFAITTGSAHPTVAFANFDGNPPKVYDIDGDGDKEIIAQNDNQWVYIFDSRNGKLLAELKTVFPSGWGARSFNGPEVNILNSDGKVHLILANSAAIITSYTYDPAGSTSLHFAFKKDWERRLTDCHAGAGMDAKPVLADLDKDGRFEILAATEENGIYALRDNGAVYWKKCIGGGNAEPTVGDLNLDGWPDVVFGSDGGTVTAMNGRTGATMWSYWATGPFKLGSGSMPVGVAIGQLDGLGGPDVVVGARDSHNATDFSKDHALLLALDSGGRVLWGRQDPTGNPLTYTHPIIVDAAGDGQAEVYWADWNTIGHKPPYKESDSWKVTGPANFYRYDKAGNLVWKQTLSTYWNNKDVPLADVDGDGVQEMLASSPGPGGDGLYYLDTRTGAKEAFVSLHPWKLMRAPVVADLYGDGKMQWVAQVAAADSTAGGPGILVYSTGSNYNSVWPHLPYPTLGGATTTTSTSSTGTATSTATSTTTSSTTTSTNPGGFWAEFTVSNNVNEWWVEVAVQANEPLAKVEAQVNGGALTQLPANDWGSYSKSFFVARGSQVVFSATGVGGAVATSQPFTWLGPATGGAFEATFSPTAVGNDWWIETGVRANQPIAMVEGKVNSGAWTALPKQSWGNYAKSINAPNGSTVTFRATSTDGSVVTSAGSVWP